MFNQKIIDMRIKFFLLLWLFINVSFLSAQTVSELEAKEVAMRVLQSDEVVLAGQLADEEGSPTLYLFNAKKGYVVVAADKCVPPILAYSYEGDFVWDNPAPAVMMWLESYSRQIADARKHNLAPHTAWSSVGTKDSINSIRNEVKPFLTSKWGQGRSYNYYCPMDKGGENGRCVTGCVATALAQIIYYYRFPTSGVGNYSYEDENYGTISANFEEAFYDYDRMNDVPFGINTAISRLMKDCGVACDLVYGAGATGMYNHKAAYALRTHFKYDANTEYIFRDSVSLNWDSLLVTKLEEKIPLYYAGWSVPNISGHAFVCDGYQQMNDTSYYYHFNFGWDGYYDGYFYIDNLRPGGSNFNLAQELIVAYPDTINYSYQPNYVLSGSHTFVAESGSFEDGSGPFHDCLPNLDYDWFIRPQLDNVTQINLNLYFDLGMGDSLCIYSPSLALPIIFTDTIGSCSLSIMDTEVDVHLQTDSVTTGVKGVFVSYAAIFPEYCTNALLVTSPSGTITDRSGDDHYQNLTYCKTYLSIGGHTAIHIDFTEFDLEAGKDFLYVYNNKGPDTLIMALTGALETTSYTFNTNRLIFVFVTDEENYGSGFSFDYYAGMASVDDDLTLHASLYPNPTKGEVIIELEDMPSSQTFCQIYDVYGKMLRSCSLEHLSTTLSVSDLAQGVYLFQIKNRDKSWVQKVVIAR